MDEPELRAAQSTVAKLGVGGEPRRDAAPSSESSLAGVYRQRAALIARPAAAASSATGKDRVVLFQLGGEIYGLAMGVLDKVYVHPNRTCVPGVDTRWAGVFSVQGEIVPILDLARVLDLPEDNRDPGECVLTLRAEGRKLGLLVGRVLEIRDIPAGDLRAAGNQARYLKGVSPDHVLVLDIDLLTEQEFSR